MAEKSYSVRLSDETIADIKEMAEAQGMTATAVVHKAIATEKFIREQIESGARIIIHKGNSLQEVLFK
jgi:predicted transcriptional regulator